MRFADSAKSTADEETANRHWEPSGVANEGAKAGDGRAPE
jgi:hypothetical protein